MTWQRRARAALVVAGLAAAAIVFLVSRSRPEPAPITLAPTDREAIREGGAMTSSRISYSTEDLLVTAEAWKDYDDGTTWYREVYVRFENDDVEVWAGEALSRGREPGSDVPAVLELSDDVRLRTQDGLELRTASAIYQAAPGIVTMPGEVTITKGRLTATGVGGYHDRDQELFTLREQAHAVVVPAEGGADTDVVDATSSSMTMARLEHFMRLEGQARIERPGETLSGDLATIHFTEGTEDVRLLDLRGHAAVVPREGVENPPPEMRGDTIAMTFHPEHRTLSQATLTGSASLILREAAGRRSVDAGWIDVLTDEDGRSLRQLTARDRVVVELPATGTAPARTIRAPALTATGAAGQGLQSARFEGGVEFVEHPAASGAATRTGRSRVLDLRLDGGFDAIDEAEFLGQVRFETGETTASAERAVYGASTDALVLHPVTSDAGAAALPHAENSRLAIDGRLITLGLGNDAVRASGDVRTVMKPQPANADRPTALFAPDRPVVGTADEFEYEEATGRAIYRGTEEAPARLLQDGSEVSGRLIEVDEESGNLTATTSVESAFVVERGDAAADEAEPATYRIVAEALEYRETERTATYRGAPVRLTSGTVETEAEVVVLTIAEQGGDVDAVDWQGAAVYALLEGRYEAKGTRLHYNVETGEYRLEGSPAVTKLPGENGADCTRQSGNVVLFNRRAGEAPSWPPGENRRGRLLNQPMKCGDSIR
jgi:lipopolysaccharide export system protein LptA